MPFNYPSVRTIQLTRIHRGYRHIYSPGHPRSHTKSVGGLTNYVQEHILIAEKALGYYLDVKHPVHHVDENKLNNKSNNLVICEDHAYHVLLHSKMKVLRAGGDPHKDLICVKCNLIKLPSEFNYSSDSVSGRQSYCKKCKNIHYKQSI